jgi:hypothetical protein
MAVNAIEYVKLPLITTQKAAAVRITERIKPMV